jgi:hypothetical protein
MSHHHVLQCYSFEVVHDVAVLHNEHNVSHHVLCCYSLEVVHDVVKDKWGTNLKQEEKVQQRAWRVPGGKIGSAQAQGQSKGQRMRKLALITSKSVQAHSAQGQRKRPQTGVKSKHDWTNGGQT